MDIKGKPANIYLFNCDNTCNLDPIESLLLTVENDVKMRFTVHKRNFRLREMSEMSETVIPGLKLDFAVFAVNAHESRLSINEDNAGIGYASLYRALQRASGDKVLIVIGGDNSYKDTDEEKDRSVISRWARRKVASQFEEEYLDGRQSFIFSWDKKYREIHQQALLHYFDPSKTGKKFEYQPKPKPQPKPQPEPQPKPQPKPQLIPQPEPIPQPPVGPIKEDTTVDMEDPGQNSWPEGAVLLDTRIRNGRISFEVGDVKIWEKPWKPSEKAIQDIARDWGTVLEVCVQFRSLGSGDVTYTVSKVPSSCEPRWFEWWKLPRVALLTFLGVVGLAIYGIWRLALVYNRPRMPDQ